MPPSFGPSGSDLRQEGLEAGFPAVLWEDQPCVKRRRKEKQNMRATISVRKKTAADSTFGMAKTEATRAEMSAAKLPLAYRDQCAHLLIPLNKCRYDNYYLPWRCSDERHGYEKCQYEEFKQRVKKMDEIRAEKDGARSN
ncbi:hypothetical protein D0867_00643 [Hortaea werneckii]|uniref:NADH dehydrogenase [ubiquinone] 1 beta subcomplex subunit 7 n=1 Tax=Hortaea werneckii TaxID=91943 RepID=A0A3M7ADH2_HORWE|nr:hypothetical protein D0867_00643 [Hortaea werneckii]